MEDASDVKVPRHWVDIRMIYCWSEYDGLSHTNITTYTAHIIITAILHVNLNQPVVPLKQGL